MRSAITVSLVAEARLGPFVFHDGLADACSHAKKLGFDAVEVFPPDADTVRRDGLAQLLRQNDLSLAAVGTGAGWVKHQLTLTAASEDVRKAALEFVRSIIQVAGENGAPAIIGSMQGRSDAVVSKESALAMLADSLAELSEYAHNHFGTQLLMEPLNRYESNLLNRVDETADWIASNRLSHVQILADLFHMNIEEADMARAIGSAGTAIGHVHFADSNRSAVGLGHSPIASAIDALRSIGYAGYLSAEIFPKPDAISAARQTIESFRRFVAPGASHA